jgi:hypothetical protein
VTGPPERDLVTLWAEILDGFRLRETEQVTNVLDRARAAADGSGEWRSWSFLTLQIQLAAERIQVRQSVGHVASTDVWVDVPEDPNSEWVEVKTRIRTLIGEIPFANWFEPSRQIEREGTALTIAVPDAATRDFLDFDYREVITKVASAMGLDTVLIPCTLLLTTGAGRRMVKRSRRT